MKFYDKGRNWWDKKAQLTSLLLHLAVKAVQDVMESMELTIDEDGEEDIYVPPPPPRPSLLWTFYCSGQPYTQAICFPPDEPKDNTVSQYITRIKTQAQFCSFADCTDQIRDQILQTMLYGKLRESLLEIGDITLDVCLQ